MQTRGIKPLVAAMCMFGMAETVQALNFRVVCDRADRVYRRGDTVVFTVTAYETNDLWALEGPLARNGKVRWTLDAFETGRLRGEGQIDLAKANPFVVRGRLDRPGFLRLDLQADGFRYPFGIKGWSAAYEPQKIRQTGRCPADFDDFWAKSAAKLEREVPLDVRIVPYPEKSTSDYDYFRISFATFGRRIYGFLSRPKDAKARKYPARVHIASAGWGDWTNFQPGRKGMVFLWFSVYPFEPSWDWKTDGTTAKFAAMNKDCADRWGWDGYQYAGIGGGKSDYFFHAVILGISRAVDWLAAEPYVDKANITYQGGSQSGGLGLMLLGLNHRFRKGFMTVPGLCDLHAEKEGRTSGWPQFLSNARTSDKRKAAEVNVPYYDAVNFAERITCPVRFSVGFRDSICVPPSVYSAYNALRVEKSIFHAVDSGHGMPDKLFGSFEKWLEEAP